VRVLWSRDRWRYVTLKSQGHGPEIFEAQYLGNRARYRVGVNRPPIGNHRLRVLWSRDRWRHVTINGGVYCCLKFNPACCKTIILIRHLHFDTVVTYFRFYFAGVVLYVISLSCHGCVRGRHGQGQRELILDQSHVCLWNSTWLVRLHRFYVVEEKRQLKVQHR